MKSISTRGIICLKDELNIEYRLCTLEYIINEDETFKYIFKPNYEIISLMNHEVFQGIPGLNLDNKKEEYTRENIKPVFITERVPSEKREDFHELLSEVGLDYMDPIEYLIRTTKRYSGDKFYLIPFEEKKTIIVDNIANKNNINGIIKIILENIAAGNDVCVDGHVIKERKSLFITLLYLYKKNIKSIKEKQQEGIYEARKNGKYQGRKPIAVDKLLFNETVEKVTYGNLTPKEAAKQLGISIDKYYRLKKQYKNDEI